MVPFGTRIVLAPPPWPATLLVVAMALLCIEFAALMCWIWRRRKARVAGAMTAAVLLAGAPLTLVLAVWGAAVRSVGERFKHSGLLKACAWNALIGLLVLVAMRWQEQTRAGAAAAIGVCALIWAVRGYSKTTSGLKGKWKAILLGLRLATIAMLVLWALGPTLERPYTQEIRGTLLIGFDVSASMALPDMAANLAPAGAGADDSAITRIAAVRRAMRQHDAELRKLADQTDVRVFLFGVSADAGRELPAAKDWDDLLASADRSETDIGDSVDEAASRVMTSGGEVAGVLLISDGSNNTSRRFTPEAMTKTMSDLGLRVYTAGVGHAAGDPAGAIPCVDVRELEAPSKVDAFNKVPIRAKVFIDALADREVRVQCRFGDELIADETVAVPTDSYVYTFKHDYLATRTGLHRVTVSAAPTGKPPRRLTGGPARKLVQVQDNKIRILYVEGKFRYETKYITQAIAAAAGGEGPANRQAGVEKRFDIDRRVLIQPMGAAGDGGAFADIGDDENKWMRYHAIILGDVGPEQFTAAQQEIMRKLVDEYGKGFCMIGGDASYGKGAWADTPIAKMMPVDLSKCTGQITEPVRVLPTAEGLASPLMQVGGAKSADVRSLWANLDALPGASVLGGVKQGATVLATTDGTPDGRPMIVRQEYGKGRVLAIAFDTTWRWVLSPKDTAEAQRRFWRQVVLYLSAPKGNVWIETSQPSYDLRRVQAGEETINVSATVTDSSGTSITTITPKVELFAVEGEAIAGAPIGLVSMSADEARRQYVGDVHPAAIRLSPDKRYALRMTASVEGKELTEEHQFEIVAPSPDARDGAADLAMLEMLSRRTRGEFRRLNKFGELLRLIQPAVAPRKEQRVWQSNIGAALRWPIIVTLISLLCAEWALRKRRGLV